MFCWQCVTGSEQMQEFKQPTNSLFTPHPTKKERGRMKYRYWWRLFKRRFKLEERELLREFVDITHAQRVSQRSKGIWPSGTPAPPSYRERERKKESKPLLSRISRINNCHICIIIIMIFIIITTTTTVNFPERCTLITDWRCHDFYAS